MDINKAGFEKVQMLYLLDINNTHNECETLHANINLIYKKSPQGSFNKTNKTISFVCE